ncbi:MAG TPA: MFS transporter [Actinocrinis sp.]|nr:MFS transporter [Actinocrinis sp.]
MLAVLRIRDFRLMATGRLLSSLGDWLLVVAAPFYVFRLTGSALATGCALAVETAPALLLAPAAGLHADRRDRRSTLIAADLLRAAAVASMASVRHGGQVWAIYAALFAESSVTQFANPAWRAVVPAVVGRGEALSAANSVSSLIGGVVRLLGGPLGGALYAVTGFRTVVALDAASYLASALACTLLRYRHARDAEVPPPGSAPGSPAGDLREAVGHIRGAPGLPALIATAAIFFGGNGMLTAILIPYVSADLHAGSTTIGLLFCALGVGYLAGSGVSRYAARRDDRTVLVVSLACLAGVFVAAFSLHSTAWDVALFTLIGPPAACFLVTTDTRLTRATPDRLMGRISAAYNLAQSATEFVGMLAGAVSAQRIGPTATAYLAAAVIAGSAVLATRVGPAQPLRGVSDN